MSLFKARDWWSTAVGEEEEFDQGCLCVANIDNHSSGQDKIIVGSFHGTLRIYHPRPTRGENGWSGFKIEDVLLETTLQQPIIQIEAGRFVSVNEKLHLAILHPRKLAVYGVSAVTGAVEHGCHYQLNQMYEHNLQRTSFCMSTGPFGGVKNKDFLCVQSMDGTVSVFEQESFSFSRFLPGALLPGPLKYVEKTDSFVTVSSSRQVESYRYQVLAVATDAKTKEESQNIKSGKKVAMDWSFNMGEQALDITVVQFSQAPISIFVLGEKNIFCLTEFGKLRFAKKLEYNPSCFLPYASLTENKINYAVGTHTSSLMVYQDATLKWSAQLQHVPVQIKLGSFQDLKGVIVTLSHQGHIDCSYLGTDPAMMVTPATESREINYSEQDDEMKHLQSIIKKQGHKTIILPTVSSDNDIQIVASVPSNLDSISQAQGVEVQDEDTVPSITVKVQVKSKALVNNVKLTIHAPSPLAVSQSLYSFPVVDSNRPVDVFVAFFLKFHCLPADLAGLATATYTNASGAPRVTHAVINLPLKLVIKPCLPIKNATYKVTVETNKPPVNLNDIYPDLLGESAGGPGMALGFQHYGGPVITVLASKSSQRYRLQCENFEAMWLITKDLLQRLENRFGAGRSSDFKASFAGPVPLQEYFEVIDAHFEYRTNTEKYAELLSQRASQFRSIQRRLLTRFKDKTPAPLANLDTLLDGTFRQLLAIADASEDNMRAQEKAASNLSCATRLINLLLKLWVDMQDDQFAVLENTLSPNITLGTEQGWEEMVDMAITHLLRTCLSKSSKDQTVTPSPITMAKDTTKLKKHIALLCERLGKGAKLFVEGQATSAGSSNSTASSPPKKSPMQRQTSEEDNNIKLGEAEVPIGSKFGEKKSPRNNNNLSPLSGSGKLAPLGGNNPLPPLSGGKLGDLKKKNNIENQVPDLDELGSSDNYHPILTNGHKEDDEMAV